MTSCRGRLSHMHDTTPHHLALTTTPTAIFSPPSGRSNGWGGGGGTGVCGVHLPACLGSSTYTGPSDSLPLYDNFTRLLHSIFHECGHVLARFFSFFIQKCFVFIKIFRTLDLSTAHAFSTIFLCLPLNFLLLGWINLEASIYITNSGPSQFFRLKNPLKMKDVGFCSNFFRGVFDLCGRYLVDWNVFFTHILWPCDPTTCRTRFRLHTPWFLFQLITTMVGLWSLVFYLKSDMLKFNVKFILDYSWNDFPD